MKIKREKKFLFDKRHTYESLVISHVSVFHGSVRFKVRICVQVSELVVIYKILFVNLLKRMIFIFYSYYTEKTGNLNQMKYNWGKWKIWSNVQKYIVYLNQVYLPFFKLNSLDSSKFHLIQLKIYLVIVTKKFFFQCTLNKNNLQSVASISTFSGSKIKVKISLNNPTDK